MPLTYPINAVEAETFLRALAPLSASTPKFVFQTYSDVLDPTLPADPLLRTPAGTLSDVLPALQSVTEHRAAVCIQINEGAKRGKQYITAVRAVWIDLDSIESATLRDIAAVMPRPTAVVASSPGKYHIYWRVLDCSLEQFKSVQVRLAAAFRADPSVNNLDRVMRLPGTWHFKYPIATQVKLLSHSDCYYSAAVLLACLSPAAIVGLVTPGRLTHSRKSLTDALICVSEKFALPDRLGKGERTSLLVRYSGSLSRQGYSEEAIRVELTRVNLLQCDPPLTDAEMEAEVHQAASKFIANDRAKTDAAILQPESTPAISGPFNMAAGARQRATMDEFIRRYVLITMRAEVADLECPQPHMSVTPFEKFKLDMMNKRIGDEPLAANWIKSKDRQSVIDTTYFPEQSRIVELDGLKYYNTYTPSNISPAETFDAAKAMPFFNHIDYMFGKDTEEQATFKNWLATTVQLPAERIPWAPLIISAPGVGKGWLYQVLQVLLGTHNCKMITSDAIGERGSTFNEWLSGTLLVCIDEMDSGSKWADMNRLKSILTEPFQVINKKYGVKREERVFANLLCFSNSKSAAAITDGERRFWVHEVPHKAVATPGYYASLFAWLKTDGPAHLLRWCLDHDISNFDFAAPPPMTAAKRDMIAATRPEIERHLFDAIEDGNGCFAADIVSYQQIKDAMVKALGEDRLPQNMAYALRNAIQKLTNPAPKRRYRVMQKNIPARVYLYCLRNFEQWATVDTEQIIAEYTRSLALEYPRSPSNVANLRK